MIENKLQNTRRNDFSLVRIPESCPDTLTWWMEQYFQFEVTTSKLSQKVQRRDIGRFIQFIVLENGDDQREQWTPRLSRAYQEFLRNTVKEEGSRHWSDRTINRMIAHLKTFSKWINKLRPFPLGNPMHKIRTLQVGFRLDVEKAVTPAERRKLLDAADRLPEIGGRSVDRHRYRGKKRPPRKGYRAFRNRAIIYTLMETGMRRGAVCRINLDDVNFKTKSISVPEKGGLVQEYKISNEGLEAIRDYIQEERKQDEVFFKTPALFLSAGNKQNSKGRLSAQNINRIWNEVANIAGVEGKTPHAARHGMGKHILKKTGNIDAVKKQLGHVNVVYSIQYAQATGEELEKALNERE
ncbi:site-specific integrase [bacterium]|nr:site-specific integrase [bacterium]